MDRQEDILKWIQLQEKSNSRAYGGRQSTRIVKTLLVDVIDVNDLVNLSSTEIPLISVNPSLTFKIWAIDFIEPFPIPAKQSGARYIITVVEYVTKWAIAKPVDTCSSEVVDKFIYENIITRFGCPLTLISDQGTHFINKTIKHLIDQFHIDHRRSTTYHPQSNGAIEAFNKTLTKGLTKICSIDKDDWDEKIPAVLWAYRTAYKWLTDQTPF